MSRRRVLTPLLIAILMLTSTYNVSATDSDGDGTDDANDAFRARIEFVAGTGLGDDDREFVSAEPAGDKED